MKISVDTRSFAGALQKVRSIVSTTSTLPILSNVLLKAESDKLEIMATDLDMTVKCSIPAKVEKAGATTLSAKRITDIARSLVEENTTLETSDKHETLVKNAKSKFRVLGITDEEFPPMPPVDAKSVTIPGKQLRDALNSTSFAASTDASCYMLNGVLFAFTGKNLALVATDGRRLAMMSIPIEHDVISVIVPSKAVSELVRNLDESDVKVSITDKNIVFEFGAMLILTKLIDGTYPNYEQVIPKDTTWSVGVDSHAMMAVIRRVSLMSNDSSSIRLAFNEKANAVKFSANNAEVGDADESLDLTNPVKDLEIVFNAQFLMQSLNAVGEKATIAFTDGISPCLMTNNGTLRQVVMPMRDN